MQGGAPGAASAPAATEGPRPRAKRRPGVASFCRPFRPRACGVRSRAHAVVSRLAAGSVRSVALARARLVSSQEECAACQDETDLKRETSRKLKEEVIDNDRLTLANLNRIKHLEAQLEQQARRTHRHAWPYGTR